MGEQIFAAIRRHFVVFPMILICFVAAGFGINMLLQPEYQAKSTLIANFGKASDNVSNKYNELLANQMLTTTYQEAIQSLFIANIVKLKLSSSLTPSELLRKIQVKTDPGALILSIYANANDANQAVAIANAFAESFVSNSTLILNQANVNVLDLAVYENSSSPVKPKKMFNLAVCTFVGFFAATSFSLLLDKKRLKKVKKKERIPNFRLEAQVKREAPTQLEV
ncbi:GNVR domain-containing protein [Paenibacillus qinlingensis]|uniref:Capsular polysaccharide biosynthesis protein n=1 Tax=Paenibacillus qinlingensis TaxID=1837343 RepID=A0ABU1P2A8_9BACL|nr:GNVR domain-containing protein [Paenibacillus qinlingensis]MDR6553885.1 capsular polysaccharide biosynthesis protein [Paenibacillus qinlingensis]